MHCIKYLTIFIVGDLSDVVEPGLIYLFLRRLWYIIYNMVISRVYDGKAVFSFHKLLLHMITIKKERIAAYNPYYMFPRH